MDIRLEDHPALILVFGMEGCPACSAYIPAVRAVHRRHPDVPAYVVDCNRVTHAADHYNVKVTPTTVLLRHGRVEKRFEGEGSRADLEKLFRHAESFL